jgi:hypothetical protein
VQAILDEHVDAVELRGMLRLRRAQLEAQLVADAARLTGVEARLRIIEEEGHRNTEDVVLEEVAPVRVAELAATAAGDGPSTSNRSSDRSTPSCSSALKPLA